jgi:uncharacterized protein (TIRG00374 family)
MFANKRFRLVLMILVGLALLLAGARFVDMASTLDEADDYPWFNLGPVLLLSLAYYLLKALRWHYYLSVIGIHLPLRRSVLTYLAGQWFALSAAGEFVRVYLLSPYGYSFTQASATISVQVLLDLLSLAVVASIAALWFGGVAVLVLPFTALLVAIIAAWLYARRIAGWKWFPSALYSKVAGWIPWSEFYDISHQLLRWRPLVMGSVLGILGVLIGSAVLFIISHDHGIAINVGQSTYIYTLSQLAGTLSMLPLGLGAVEASSVALFGYVGVFTGHALAAVVLFRLCTAGWGLLLGGLSLLSLRTPLAGPSMAKIDQADLARAN